MNKSMVHTTLGFALLLALAGGFLDAYSYIARGGVFANAQTGNIVLIGIRIAQREWFTVLHYLKPVCAFVAGVFLSEILKKKSTPQFREHWPITVLAIELALLYSNTFFAEVLDDDLVNITISFVCALQVSAFRHVSGHPYASTMITGNLRSMTDAFFEYLENGRSESLAKAGHYAVVIVTFTAGAAIGGCAVARFGKAALAAVPFTLTAAFIWVLIDSFRKK